MYPCRHKRWKNVFIAIGWKIFLFYLPIYIFLISFTPSSPLFSRLTKSCWIKVYCCELLTFTKLTFYILIFCSLHHPVMSLMMTREIIRAQDIGICIDTEKGGEIVSPLTWKEDAFIIIYEGIILLQCNTFLSGSRTCSAFVKKTKLLKFVRLQATFFSERTHLTIKAQYKFFNPSIKFNSKD